ncbi:MULTISPECIES: IclR family transcriptional regulator [Brevibacterium]|uniref:IclR family transcriptional regulator n=1 Tax=Brevibacterium salitolerans TaxID=1403566 RepID=A0ABN2WV11_9MICO|nr:IclR family transcriptional regulator [Brevibacterium sp.]
MRDEANADQSSVERNDGNRSFRRAATILDALGRAQEQEGASLSLARLAEDTGLAKSTVHRLLRALQEVGLVGGDAQSGYVLGRGLIRLGTLAGQAHRDLSAVSDALRRLAAFTGDTCFYTERTGTVSVCVLREDGNGPFRNNVLAVGDRHPLGIGAGALAILGALPEDEADRVQEENARTFDESTSSGRTLRSEQFAQALAATRETGWALNTGMVVEESWAAGVALPPGPGGAVRGALSVASIRSRLQEPRLTQIVAALRHEAAALAPHPHLEEEK